MSAKRNKCWYLLIIIGIVYFMGMFQKAYAQEPNSAAMTIRTSKDAFYPGEPLLLIIDINNTGTQEEEVFFGGDGISSFSMEIIDSNNTTVAKGEKIPAKGGCFTPRRSLLPPGKITPAFVVLNRWCSTILPPGQYHVICNTEYWLHSEDIKIGDSNCFTPCPLHKKQFKLNIKIIEMDKNKYKDVLKSLALPEIKPENLDDVNYRKWLDQQDLKSEMLAFAETELAVPYQLQKLRTDSYNRFMRDTINSLVKSGTLEAANGLVQIIEDEEKSLIYKNCEGCIKLFVDGVYRLRDTKRADILNATEKIASKYERPIILSSPD